MNNELWKACKAAIEAIDASTKLRAADKLELAGLITEHYGFKAAHGRKAE